MWNFIIILIIFFVGKFIFDSIAQSKEIKSQGGIKTKYAQLIQMLLASDPKAKIIQESNNFVNIGVSGPGGAQSFFLRQTFGELTVQIVIKNNPLLGNMTIERSFPENMSQEEMMNELMETQLTEVTKKLNRYQ